MSYGLDYEDFNKFIEAIKQYPLNAEEAINNYMHGDGAVLITDSITNHIPVSVGRYAAHKNLRKTYKHKKASKHAKEAKWYLAKECNLGINIKNKGIYYYLYFVENGLGTSEKSGGVDFVNKGIDDIYAKITGDLIDCLKWEE